jgi:hypothetical protein
MKTKDIERIAATSAADYTPNGFEMKGFNNMDFSAGYKFRKSCLCNSKDLK